MTKITYQKALTFSYDDGVRQDRQLTALLNRYGMKATFNLNTGIQSGESQFMIGKELICRMEQEGLNELYEGHEIAVHGLTHVAPTGMNSQQLQEEFLQDAVNIETLYGKYPEGMAYAYGAYDKATIDYLKEIGIKYARTVESSKNFTVPEEPMQLKATCHHEDEDLFELAQEFLQTVPKPGQQMLFYVWGHSYEFAVNQNWDRIEKLCQMLGGRNEIYYGTNAQCLKLFQCI